MERFAGAPAVPMCAADVFLSLSRGGLVALGAMMIAGTLFAGRFRRGAHGNAAVVALGGVVYFTAIAPLPARERVTSSNGGTGRSDIWKLGLRMVRAHPLEGVGVGQFPEVSADYALQPGTLERADLVFSSAPKVTHNTYLEIMSEDGIPGFLLFLALLGSCLAAAPEGGACVGRARGSGDGGSGSCGLPRPARHARRRLLHLRDDSKLLSVMLALGPALLAVARAEAAAAETEQTTPANASRALTRVYLANGPPGRARRARGRAPRLQSNEP